MRALSVAPASVAVAMALLACSSDGGTSSASSSSGGSSGTTTSSSGGSSGTTSSGSVPACDPPLTLAQKGSPYLVVSTKAAPPAAQGGTIADGTWVATSAKVYESKSEEGKEANSGGAITLKISGTSFEEVVSTVGDTRTAGTFSASASQITFTQTCIDPLGANAGSLDGTYTVDATTLRMFSPKDSSGETFEVVFTKQ